MGDDVHNDNAIQLHQISTWVARATYVSRTEGYVIVFDSPPT